MFSHPCEQTIYLLFLTGLQGLDLQHVFFSETADFFLQGLILCLRVVIVVTTVMSVCVMRIRV